MKTQGKVNKRLFSKTELAIHKVELAMIDEIQQLGVKAQKISSVMRQNAEKVEKVFQSVNKENKKLQQKAFALRDEGIKKYMKASRMFKELGMKPPATLEKSISAFSSLNTGNYISHNTRIFIG